MAHSSGDAGTVSHVGLHPLMIGPITSPSVPTRHSTGILPSGESLKAWVCSDRRLPCSSMPRVRRSCIKPVLIRCRLAITASVCYIVRSTDESISAILVCSGLGGPKTSKFRKVLDVYPLHGGADSEVFDLGTDRV